MNEPRADRSFDVTLCADCRGRIVKGEPKVARGTGWICQACAYALSRPLPKGTGS